MRHKRLNDESGIALIMAVGVMFVLALALTTIISFSTSNEAAARYGKAEQEAFSLAEAGINNAYGVLAKASLASPTVPVTDLSLLQPARTTTYETGSVSWTGTYDVAAQRWTLTSTATARNPSGGSDVKRAVTATVLVTPAPGQPNNTPIWNFVTMRSTGSPCDLDLQNSMTLSARLYLPGNLCVRGSAEVTGGPLLVGGDVTLIGNGNSLGETLSPLPAGTLPYDHTAIGGGCKYFNNPRADCKNGAGPLYSNIWVSDGGGPLLLGAAIPKDFPLLTPPSHDFAAEYGAGHPGPVNNTCALAPEFPVGTLVLPASTFDTNTTFDPGTDGSIATPFDLAPSSYSYTCKTVLGELSWNKDTKKLTVQGRVFIDGSAFISGSGHTTKVFDYDGKGLLTLTGTMLFSNLVKVCAVPAATSCDQGAWDPDTDMLMILADGNGGQVPVGRSIALENSTFYQGALYGTNAIELQNQATVQGPMLGETLFSTNIAQALSFPYITELPAGAPGNPVTTYTLVKENFVD